MLSDYLSKTKASTGLSRFTTNQPTSTANLKTSAGLYGLAVQSGLQGQADRIMGEKGEEANKLFSGGFISDVFDVLNAAQYGIVGVLKGKGFNEGVKTRQSWSDKDALGEFGIPGMIGGIALDIGCDPLTYIAPWTIAKKIPGVSKGAKALVSKVFGKMGKVAIKTSKGAMDMDVLQGGTKAGRWLAEKFKYQFGHSKVYKDALQRQVRATAKGVRNTMDIIKPIADTPENIKNINKILTRTADNRIVRKSADEIRKLLPADVAKRVISLGDDIDKNGKKLFKLAGMSEDIWLENKGKYIANLYEEFEKKPGIIKQVSKKLGVSGKRLKKAHLTDIVKRKELGEITNAPYLLARTNIELIKDVENITLFNAISKNLATDVATEGFEQLPKTARLFTSATGKKISLMSDIKNINKQLKPTFNTLKKTFSADRKILSEIDSIEKAMVKFGAMRSDEFAKFFQAGQEITKTIPEWRRLGTLPDELVGIGSKVKKFKNFDDLMKSDVGLALEKLDTSGKLERLGFNKVDDFFDYVKNPFKAKPSKVVSEIAEENVQKLIKLQKGIENLSLKATKLKGVDKTSIDDAYRFLEDTIQQATSKKEVISSAIEATKMGELGGKFVPKYISDAINEISRKKGVNEMVIGNIVAGFKFGKVVMNPATHGRNVISNTLLNWWKLGIGPWRIDKYIDGIKELKVKGNIFKKAVAQGMDDATYAANELGEILTKGDALSALKGKNIIQKSMDFFGNIYQGEEKIAKIVAFKEMLRRGMTDEDAWKAAVSATFDYAAVTPFIRKLRTSLFGFPFITFTTKATPVAVETILKHPGRISAFGKIRTAIENQSDIHLTAREKAAEPSWVRDGFYIKLPIKDKEGRSAYFDLTYIMPFGDLVSGDFVDKQISRETGIQEGTAQGLMRKSPFFNFIKEISSNQDFYGNKIWRDGDNETQQLGDLFRHLTKTYSPPLIADQIPGGYQTKGKYIGQRRPTTLARTKMAEGTQQRNLMQEMMRNVGLKIQPVDVDIQESYMEAERKRALQTLLNESGVLKEYQTFYQPKQ